MADLDTCQYQTILHAEPPRTRAATMECAW